MDAPDAYWIDYLRRNGRQARTEASCSRKRESPLPFPIVAVSAMEVTQTDPQNPLSPRANAFSIAALISPEDRTTAEEALSAATNCNGTSGGNGDVTVESLEEWSLRYNTDFDMEGLSYFSSNTGKTFAEYSVISFYGHCGL